MSLNPSSLTHVSGPQAIEIARQINGGTISADLLSRIGIAGPIAIELARQMHAGAGGQANIDALFRMGFCATDAQAIVTAIAAAGAR